MSYSALSHLVCSRTRQPATTPTACRGVSDGGCAPLAWPSTTSTRARRTMTREAIAGRPPTLWRYHEMLPVRNPAHVVTLGEGMTPLLPLPR